MLIMTACAAIGMGYFVISTATLTLTSGCSEIRPSVRKWSWDNLSLKQQASAPWSALKGRLASSSASTFLCNDSRDDIFAKEAMPTSTGTTGSPMPVHIPSNVYSDQLSALSHGIALWNPNPPKKIYYTVSIGDVGYLHQGTFIRMFNVMLPWDDPSNRTLGDPKPYESLDCAPFFNTLKSHFNRVDHYSRHVSAETHRVGVQAMTPDELVIVPSRTTSTNLTFLQRRQCHV